MIANVNRKQIYCTTKSKFLKFLLQNGERIMQEMSFIEKSPGFFLFCFLQWHSKSSFRQHGHLRRNLQVCILRQ